MHNLWMKTLRFMLPYALPKKRKSRILEGKCLGKSL